MFKKIVCLSLGLFICLMPVFVYGAEEATPEKNPICWTKDDCQKARLNTTGKDTGDGWIQEAPCTGDWGKCLAGGLTKTEITFGGANTFTDAGSFIKTIYNFSISVISIIAVVVIIISGLQWASSAGNSEVISSAKNRIAGALIGALIAFMSFVILNTINPATVNLRLPQTWLTRNIPVPLKWCQDYSPKEVDDNALLSIDDNYLDSVASKVKLYDIRQFKGVKMKKADTRCGLQYMVPGSQNTCLGNTCQGVTVMSPTDVTQTIQCGITGPCACYTAGVSVPYCIPSFFGGQVKLADEDHYVDDITLWAVCSYSNQPGVIQRLARVDSTDVGQYMEKNYGIYFSASDVARRGEAVCGAEYDLEGFVATAEVNDNSGSITIDDTWLIGFDNCGNGKSPFAGFNFSGETGTLWDDKDALKIVADMFTASNAWSAADLTAGVTCDLDINMQSYPNLSEDLYVQ